VKPGRDASSWTDATLAAMRTRGLRNGGSRRAVVELLGRQPCCLTAQEIFDQLRAEGHRVGIASVYRALEQLTRDGFVQRVDLGAGISRFEPIHADGLHHHHLVCDDCGRVEAFADDQLERALRKVEGKTGYFVAGHDVVVRGVCHDCGTSSAKA
jgi:Fur family ferric uptake transcriptional regulator